MNHKNFYISDIHLGHINGLKFDNRPFETTEEMSNYIKEHWNNKVTNGDDVYILGDLACKKGYKDTVVEFYSTLKGRKHLIIGNHDQVDDYRMQQIFAEICPYKEIQDQVGDQNYHLVLTHYPIYDWKNAYHGWIHLFGHVHNGDVYRMYQKNMAELNEFYQSKKKNYSKLQAYNVGCMHWNYEPVTLEEILNGKDSENR